MAKNSYQLTVNDGLAAMPGPVKDQYDVLLRAGRVEVGFYAPRGIDDQTPHTRDEAYVVMAGTGWFRNGNTRERFGPGDVLFVPAQVEHRFEEFTDDLKLWVFFWD